MSEEKAAPDLFDLKFLPAWVKETPNENRYADFAGEENACTGAARPSSARSTERGTARPGTTSRPGRKSADAIRGSSMIAGPGPERPREPRRPEEPDGSRSSARSSLCSRGSRARERPGANQSRSRRLFRLFVRANVSRQAGALRRASEERRRPRFFNWAKTDRSPRINACSRTAHSCAEKDNFYRTEVTQSEPIKGNFTSVARCRLSGTLLGPTNHHAYQPQLRSLYEQRFSRRMSFPDYQRQIEIVTDPEAVERWKEEARNVTTYVTLQEEPPLTFNSAAETERHFRQNYLPGLLRRSEELTVDGVVSRRLSDRSLGRVIEDAWTQEYRSPSKMMQELIGAFRQAGLHVFRHRKGMLFVSPVRVRPFGHGNESVSPTVVAILQALDRQPGHQSETIVGETAPSKPGG